MRTSARVDEVAFDFQQLQVLFVLYIVLLQLFKEFRQVLVLQPNYWVAAIDKENWSWSLAQVAHNVFIGGDVAASHRIKDKACYFVPSLFNWMCEWIFHGWFKRSQKCFLKHLKMSLLDIVFFHVVFTQFFKVRVHRLESWKFFHNFADSSKHSQSYLFEPCRLVNSVFGLDRKKMSQVGCFFKHIFEHNIWECVKLV